MEQAEDAGTAQVCAGVSALKTDLSPVTADVLAGFRIGQMPVDTFNYYFMLGNLDL